MELQPFTWDMVGWENAGVFVPLENDVQQKPTLKIHQIHAREYHQMEIQEEHVTFHSISIYPPRLLEK